MMHMHYRTRIEIIAAILEVSKQPVLLTTVIRKGDLNHQLWRRYSTFCLAHRLLRREEQFYQTTPRGLEYLAKLKVLVELMEASP